MKIRNGFVSNSSSSSFVVAFPRVPLSVKEVKRTLFGDAEYFIHPYDKETVYTTEEVAQIVFRDIQEQEVNDDEAITEAIYGYTETNCYLDDFKTPSGNYDWEAYNLAANTLAEKDAKQFKNRNKGKVIYTFNYSDNDSEPGSAMEHGEIFRNLDHVRVSRH
jgi:hypothetical protein